MSREASSVRSVGVLSGIKRRTLASLVLIDGLLMCDRRVSNAGIFILMGAANGAAQLVLQPSAIEDDFLVMHRFDGGQRHREIACILDIDHDLHAAIGVNLANGAEGLVP